MSSSALSIFRDIVLKNFSQEKFKYHEWMWEYHLKIVEKIAWELCDIYPNANRDIVWALVWFHDFWKPFDEKREREYTLTEWVDAMRKSGYPENFVAQTVDFWEIMEKKNEINLHDAPIEVKIISSADGASHFVWVFYPSYFNEDWENFDSTQERLRKKITKDWERKIVLPEVKKIFQKRYQYAQEMLWIFPDKFLG